MAYNYLNSRQSTLLNSGYKDLPDNKLGVYLGGFIVPRGTEIDTCELATAQSTYEGLMKLALSNRAFYIQLADTFTDKSTEDVYVETIQGPKFSEQGQIAYQYMVDANKFNSRRLRSYNNKDWDWIPFDKSGTLHGTSQDGVKFKGFSITFRAGNQKLAAQGELMMQPIDIVYKDSSEWADYGVIVEPMNLETDEWNPITDIDGVYDVDVTVSDATATTCKIQVHKAGIVATNAISDVDGLVKADFVHKSSAGVVKADTTIEASGVGGEYNVVSADIANGDTFDLVLVSAISLTNIKIESTGAATVSGIA